MDASGSSGIDVTFLLDSNNLFKFLSRVIITLVLVSIAKLHKQSSVINPNGILYSFF